MEHPDSTHPLASWARRPAVFAVATAVVGAGAFGAALLLPIGVASVALAAAGAVAAAAGLLTGLILLIARAAGLREHAPQPVAPVERPAPAPVAVQPVVDEQTQPLVIDLTDADLPHPIGR